MKVGDRRMQRIEEQFTQAMFDIYRRAKIEAGYPANTFLGMITQDGGLLTAKRLINSPKVSDGYTELHLRGRLDLTVEATVINEPRWHVLFFPEELEKAARRLKKYGYGEAPSQ